MNPADLALSIRNLPGRGPNRLILGFLPWRRPVLQETVVMVFVDGLPKAEHESISHGGVESQIPSTACIDLVFDMNELTMPIGVGDIESERRKM